MASIISQFADFILHLDNHLGDMVEEYITLTYAILFAILFIETGFVVMPFLPGDSLLFAAGAIAATTGADVLNVWLLIPLLFTAAILGDNVNYFVGKKIGSKVFSMNSRWIRKDYIERTRDFYAEHGGKTIIMARFIPIIRTFAPFVAGVGAMTYRKFISFCVLGGILWVSGLTLAGYYFANLPFVKNNFEIVIFGIIGFSLLPVAYQFLRSRLRK